MEIPSEEVDNHVKSNSNVMVRRWIRHDENAAIIAPLVIAGFSGSAQLLREALEAAAAQRITTTRLTVATVVAALFAAAFAVIAVRKYRQSGRKRSEP